MNNEEKKMEIFKSIVRIHEYVGTYTRVYADFRKWRVLEGFI